MTPLTQSHVRGATDRPLIELTIGGMLDQAAARWPDHEAVVVRHQALRWTYAELQERVDAFAAGLIALGLRPGDRIGIWSPNNIEWVITQFASAKAGLILVTINPAYLPRYQGDVAAAPVVATAPPSISVSGMTILLVEDEPGVRSLAAGTLRDSGYVVLEAADGPSGLAALASGAHVDILVTDFGLPGLNGRQLAEAARKRRPRLPVLFITGYSGVALDGGLPPGMAVMAKPFSLDALAERVATMFPVGG